MDEYNADERCRARPGQERRGLSASEPTPAGKSPGARITDSTTRRQFCHGVWTLTRYRAWRDKRHHRTAKRDKQRGASGDKPRQARGHRETERDDTGVYSKGGIQTLAFVCLRKRTCSAQASTGADPSTLHPNRVGVQTRLKAAVVCREHVSAPLWRGRQVLESFS